NDLLEAGGGAHLGEWCAEARWATLYPGVRAQRPSRFYRRESMQRGTVETFALLSLALAASGAAADPIRYGRDVRPILAEHCFACHGPDRAARKARLRLDVRDVAVAKGAIVP